MINIFFYDELKQMSRILTKTLIFEKIASIVTNVLTIN